MKLYNIFVKNLKTISRNWDYFGVLFIMPLLLIIASAVMLDSNKFENVRIGVIGSDQNDPTLNYGVGRLFFYSSLEECMFKLSNSELSVCLNIKKDENQKTIDVYVDNSRRVVDLYVRQAMLEKLFKDQTQKIQVNSDVLDTKLTLYSNSIQQARAELKNAENDLADQERQLTNYQRNLAVERQKFETAYWQIKNLQPQIQSTKSKILASQTGTTSNINSIRSQLSSIRTSITQAQEYLAPILPSQSNSQVNNYLNNVLLSVNKIEGSLNSIQSAYPYTDVISILNQLDNSISKLDDARTQLNKIERDLSNSIEQTRRTKDKIGSFKNRLTIVEGDLVDFRNNYSDGGISINFTNAFSYKDDIVLFAFPFIVSIIITFSSLILANRFILVQVNRPSYLREIISPAKNITFVIGDYFTNLFFLLIQVIVLLVIGLLRFNITTAQIFPFLLSIFLVSSVLIFIGISLGYLFKNENLSVLITIFLVMFLFIFSDILVPSILSGVFVRLLINQSPFVLLNNMLKDVILLGKNVGYLLPSIFKLGIMLVSSFLVAYLAKIASKENVIQ